MDVIIDFLSVLKGSRTYLTAGAAALTSIASYAGFIDPTYGATIAAGCIALAQIFQRMATADATAVIADTQKLLTDIKPLIETTASTVKQTTPTPIAN